MGKRSALHIGEECLSIFGVSLIFPQNSVYTERFNELILRLLASGLTQKVSTEMEWDLKRTGGGRLLQSTSSKKFKISEVEERKLNLADTEGYTIDMLFFNFSYLFNCTKSFYYRYVPLDGCWLFSCFECFGIGNRWWLCCQMSSICSSEFDIDVV